MKGTQLRPFVCWVMERERFWLVSTIRSSLLMTSGIAGQTKVGTITFLSWSSFRKLLQLGRELRPNPPMIYLVTVGKLPFSSLEKLKSHSTQRNYASFDLSLSRLEPGSFATVTTYVDKPSAKRQRRGDEGENNIHGYVSTICLF